MSRSIILLAFSLFLSNPATPLFGRDEAPARPARELKELFRYESTGLSLLRPYERGKVPVVLVHGLWASPWSWRRTIEALEADSEVNRDFQFWTYGYSTGDPLPYSAHLMRRDLDEVRQKFDPRQDDPAFERMVLVGHSMGGLLSKMIAVDSGDRIWRVISNRAAGDLQGEPKDRELLLSSMFFRANVGVRRVVYVATPHRGSRFDRGSIHGLGTRLVRLPDPLQACHQRLVAQNPPEFFREHFRRAVPTSIDELEWGSPVLTGLADLAHPPGLKVHSIIAVHPSSTPDHRTDGLVTYESAHVGGVASEKVVSAGHLCQDHAEVIGELRRILAEHAGAK
jgi:pimeloyl-ACP methyl ester carboxylesterase